MKINQKSLVFNLRSTNKGISLLETVVYISILAILSVSVVNTILTTAKALPNLRIVQNINYSGGLAMERMTREIRTAYDIDPINSLLNVSPGGLTLKTTKADNSLTTIEFYVANGSLHMKEAGIDLGSLFSQNIQIKNLIFRQILTLNSKAIKIEMEIESKIGKLPKGKQITTKLYNTIILRGSY